MGIFGKKLEKPIDEPISSAPSPYDHPMASGPVVEQPHHEPAALAYAAPPPEPPPMVAYGIEDAIRLMRSLPVEQNAELVVRVVKGTLESMNVRVADIIQDAERKENNIGDRITALKSAIGELEVEIKTRRDEIGRMQADLAETSSVKQRLRLAEKEPGKRASAAEPAASSSAAPAAPAAPVLSGAIPSK
jgi:hypothetical protein